MKAHRTIIFIGGLLALAVALPSGALASSLLSGYGGPGQGNQAILGAGLVNGPKGGGGSGGSGNSTSDSSTSGSESASAPASSSAGSTKGGSENSGSGRSARRSGGKSSPQDALAPKASSSARGLYPASERIAAGQQAGALGLSSADIVYIVLALGLLVFIGLLTRRLAQTSAAGRPR
jgi:hypothetical protein